MVIFYQEEGTKELDFKTNDVYLSYMPFVHVFERVMFMCLIYIYYSADQWKLKDDFVACKPTIIATVPEF